MGILVYRLEMSIVNNSTICISLRHSKKCAVLLVYDVSFLTIGCRICSKYMDKGCVMDLVPAIMGLNFKAFTPFMCLGQAVYHRSLRMLYTYGFPYFFSPFQPFCNPVLTLQSTCPLISITVFFVSSSN